MSPTSSDRVLDATGVAVAVVQMAESLAIEELGGRIPRVIGIHSRGVPIARRLAKELGDRLGATVPVGALDITLYRDDLDQAGRWPVLRGTDIPFEVEGADLILVDDVLFTGRTIRAALNAVCDLGRPARVRLAVLVDRGHRELPIQADAVGLDLTTERSDRIAVRFRPLDDEDAVIRLMPAPEGRSPEE